MVENGCRCKALVGCRLGPTACRTRNRRKPRPDVPESRMTLRLGPVLYFRGARDHLWSLSALVGTAANDEPAPLRTDAGDRVPPHRLAQRRGSSLWRYD